VLHDIASEEDLLVSPAEVERPQFLAHAPFADHPAGKVGGPLDIIGGTGGVLLKDDFFGHPAPHQDGDAVGKVVFGIGVAVVFGQLLSQAERAPAGNDGDLVQGIGAGQ